MNIFLYTYMVCDECTYVYVYIHILIQLLEFIYTPTCLTYIRKHSFKNILQYYS